MSFPDKFWLNGRTGQVVPVDHLHLTVLMADPETFGYDRDDIHGKFDPKIAYSHGWIRVDNTSSTAVNLETTHLRDAAEGLKFLLNHAESYTDVFIDLGREPVELEGYEEIEAFALKDRLPRRYAALQPSLLRTRRAIIDPAQAAIQPMRAVVGHAVGERMDALIAKARAKLVEFEKPNGEPGDETKTFDPEMDPNKPLDDEKEGLPIVEYRRVDLGDFEDDVPRPKGTTWTRGRPESFTLVHANGNVLKITNLSQFCRHHKWNLAAVRQAIGHGRPYKNWTITQA